MQAILGPALLSLVVSISLAHANDVQDARKKCRTAEARTFLCKPLWAQQGSHAQWIVVHCRD